jgi:hypothetical protein
MGKIISDQQIILRFAGLLKPKQPEYREPQAEDYRIVSSGINDCSCGY